MMLGNEIVKYITVATQAAVFERNKDYEKATLYWSEASVLAKNDDNFKWAIARYDYCNTRSRIFLR
ncbi:ANR family transcriptional regulator (plasmid) [Serratia ureilytica]|uniref:ANR family transcriptional regulator n=1 Tax=Serratia ureilytica TaxID=300181 RepID=UPI001CC0D938|nr:ANR family transcriptional regulator [Serratia ureilytica]UAN29731.1 ANR family transcriptional regulator [Serratia ureilytica]